MIKLVVCFCDQSISMCFNSFCILLIFKRQLELIEPGKRNSFEQAGLQSQHNKPLITKKVQISDSFTYMGLGKFKISYDANNIHQKFTLLFTL